MRQHVRIEKDEARYYVTEVICLVVVFIPSRLDNRRV